MGNPRFDPVHVRELSNAVKRLQSRVNPNLQVTITIADGGPGSCDMMQPPGKEIAVWPDSWERNPTLTYTAAISPSGLGWPSVRGVRYLELTQSGDEWSLQGEGEHPVQDGGPTTFTRSVQLTDGAKTYIALQVVGDGTITLIDADFILQINCNYPIDPGQIGHGH